MSNFEWTDEAVEQLKELHKSQKSSSQIAAVLGTTRNAVIGKIHRLNLDPKRLGVPPGAHIVKGGGVIRLNPKTQPLPPMAEPDHEAEYVMPRLPRPTKEDRESLEKLIGWTGQYSGSFAVLSLDASTCRWPVGEVGHAGFRYCLAVTAEASSYCPHHKERSSAGPGGKLKMPYDLSVTDKRPKARLVTEETVHAGDRGPGRDGGVAQHREQRRMK